MEEDDTFRRYLRQYEGSDQALVETVCRYLESELPHLLPIDPLWLASFWRELADAPPRRVNAEKRSTVLEDANRLDQIENLLNYYADKIRSVEADSSLDPEERERMKDVWIRLRENEVQRLEEDDFEEVDGDLNEDQGPPDPFDLPEKPDEEA